MFHDLSHHVVTRSIFSYVQIFGLGFLCQLNHPPGISPVATVAAVVERAALAPALRAAADEGVEGLAVEVADDGVADWGREGGDDNFPRQVEQ